MNFIGGSDNFRYFKIISVNNKKVKDKGRFKTKAYPGDAAKKIFTQLSKKYKTNKLTFTIKETTLNSTKKEHGPYLGEKIKLKKPLEVKYKGRNKPVLIKYETKIHLVKDHKQKGGGGWQCAKNIKTDKLSDICEKKYNGEFNSFESCASSEKCINNWRQSKLVCDLPSENFRICNGAIQPDSSALNIPNSTFESRAIMDYLCILKNKKQVGYFNYGLYNNFNDDDDDDNDDELEFDLTFQQKAIDIGLKVINLYENEEYQKKNLPICTLVFKEENWINARIIIQIWLDTDTVYYRYRNLIIGYCIGYPKENIIGSCKRGKLFNNDFNLFDKLQNSFGEEQTIQIMKKYNSICENEYKQTFKYIDNCFERNLLSETDDEITKKIINNSNISILRSYYIST